MSDEPTITITLPVRKVPGLLMDLGYAHGRKGTQESMDLAVEVAGQCQSLGVEFLHGCIESGVKQGRVKR